VRSTTWYAPFLDSALYGLSISGVAPELPASPLPIIIRPVRSPYKVQSGPATDRHPLIDGAINSVAGRRGDPGQNSHASVNGRHPKMLRLALKYDHKLLGGLGRCFYDSSKEILLAALPQEESSLPEAQGLAAMISIGQTGGASGLQTIQCQTLQKRYGCECAIWIPGRTRPAGAQLAAYPCRATRQDPGSDGNRDRLGYSTSHGNGTRRGAAVDARAHADGHAGSLLSCVAEAPGLEGPAPLPLMQIPNRRIRTDPRCGLPGMPRRGSATGRTVRADRCSGTGRFS